LVAQRALLGDVVRAGLGLQPNLSLGLFFRRAYNANRAVWRYFYSFGDKIYAENKKIA